MKYLLLLLLLLHGTLFAKASSVPIGLLIRTRRDFHRNHQHFFLQEAYSSGQAPKSRPTEPTRKFPQLATATPSAFGSWMTTRWKSSPRKLEKRCS
jgi:hypothetical protein